MVVDSVIQWAWLRGSTKTALRQVFGIALVLGLPKWGRSLGMVNPETQGRGCFGLPLNGLPSIAWDLTTTVLRPCSALLSVNLLPAPGHRPAVLGINFGKSKVTPLEQAPDDYAASLEHLAPWADYAVINVSSPNTPGLRDLQDSTQLRRLVERLRRLRACPPLLVKIAPDLEDDAIDGIARLAYEEGLAGVIAVNTSLNRLGLEQRRIAQTGRTLAEEAGGLSGDPLRYRAVEVIRRLRASAGPALPLIGVGGFHRQNPPGSGLLQVHLWCSCTPVGFSKAPILFRAFWMV